MKISENCYKLPSNKQIKKWSKIQLSDSKKIEFAIFAAALRWDDPFQYDSKALLGDLDPDEDLWQIAKHVHTAISVGGLTRTTLAGHRTITPPIKSVRKIIDFNLKFWQLCQEFSENALLQGSN